MQGRTNSRQAIVETASRLFFSQGYHATGLNQIIKESECPKGSLYYYFPNGKEELALECIERTRLIVLELWQATFTSEPNIVKAIPLFITGVVEDAAKDNYEGFMPFSFWMAAETANISDKLRTACKQVLSSWQQFISERLLQEGIDNKSATELGSVILSLIEGAFILTVTNRDKQPLLNAAKYVPLLLQDLIVSDK